MRNAYEVILKAHKVVFTELTPDELLQAARLSGDKSLTTAELSFAVAALPLSVKQVDGAALTYNDLLVKSLENRLGRRDLTSLARQWQKIHLGGQEELEQAFDSIEETPDGHKATVLGKSYLFPEQTMEQILASRRAADSEKSPIGKILAVGKAGLLRALKADKLELSAKEFWILGLLWAKIYGEEYGGPMGELKAVSGV